VRYIFSKKINPPNPPRTRHKPAKPATNPSHFHPPIFIIPPSEKKASPMPLKSRFSLEMGKSVRQKQPRFKGLWQPMGDMVSCRILANGARFEGIFLHDPIRAFYGVFEDGGNAVGRNRSPIWGYFRGVGSHSSSPLLSAIVHIKYVNTHRYVWWFNAQHDSFPPRRCL